MSRWNAPLAGAILVGRTGSGVTVGRCVAGAELATKGEWIEAEGGECEERGG